MRRIVIRIINGVIRRRCRIWRQAPDPGILALRRRDLLAVDLQVLLRLLDGALTSMSSPLPLSTLSTNPADAQCVG
jgi:hypothetical protein